MPGPGTLARMTASDSDLFADIDAALARMPGPSLDDLLRAREATAAAPSPRPSAIPEPRLPYLLGGGHPLAGTVRWSCVHGCGWAHDEHPGADTVSMRIVLPADFTDRDISDALTAQATDRHTTMLRRVEDALTDHYAREHPDQPRDARPRSRTVSVGAGTVTLIAARTAPRWSRTRRGAVARAAYSSAAGGWRTADFASISSLYRFMPGEAAASSVTACWNVAAASRQAAHSGELLPCLRASCWASWAVRKRVIKVSLGLLTGGW